MTRPGKVLPKDVRRVLLDPLAAPMRSLGFARAKTTHLGWQRPSKLGFECVFLPLGKYGWMPEYGAQFDLQFQDGPDVHPFSTDRLRFCWYRDLLDDAEAAQVVELHNLVARSLPHTYVEDPALPDEGPDWTDAYDAEDFDWALWACRVRARPLAWNETATMHYYRLEDVERWADFIAPRLPAWVERFAAIAPRR